MMVSDWHGASIRQGVLENWRTDLSQEFLDWAKNNCDGRYNYDSHQNKIYFENKEDIVSYLLTFDELAIPFLNIQIVKERVTAKSRKLSTKWTFEEAKSTFFNFSIRGP